MRMHRWLGGLVLGALTLVMAAFAVSPASAATIPNVCINSVTADKSGLPVEMSASAPMGSVASGTSVSLQSIDQTVQVPGGIFVTGYNFGILTTGVNEIPARIRTQIEATNTAEGTQETNEVSASISTTITDPDGNPSTDDETATPGELNAAYDNQTWTAGGPTADAGADQSVNIGASVSLDGTGSSPFLGGTVNFREETVADLSVGNPGAGGIVIGAAIGPLQISFACSPGMAVNNNAVFDDPAAPFATGPDVAAGGPITGYSWTQTSGPAVNLNGADTATPSFTAPDKSANLEFELEVDDGTATGTDAVAVTVAKSEACKTAEKKLKKAKKKLKKAKKKLKKAKKSGDKKAIKKAKKQVKKAKKQVKKAKKQVKKEC